MTVLRLNVEKYPDKKAYAYRSENTWQYITYKDLFELVKKAAKGFISFGLQRFYGVAIIGSNAPEWAIANIAAIYAGGIVVPISLAFSADECRHIIQSTRCSIVVVGSSKQLATVAQIRNRLLDIKAVIMYEKEEESDTKSFRFYTWDELLAMGDKVDDERLHERLASQAPNLCCTIAISPGTSGPSKQVMVSQDNFIWTSRSMGRRLSCNVASAVHIAVSNYSHVAGLVFNLYMPLLFASTVYYIPTMNMFQWAKEIQPTIFYAPYLAFEELRLALSAQLARSRLSRIIYCWARTIGHKGYQAMTNRRPMPICWSLANRLVYQQIRSKIGMKSSREIFTGGRVFSREALEFFASLNIPVMEIYGMTETGPVTTAAMPDMYRITSAGKDLDGCSTKILHPDKEGVGELRIRGRNVFMGYLNHPDLTSAAFDKDGWLKSGDLARIDDDGFLYYCGKTSDLVTLKCGAATQPGQMEARVLEALPIIRNCMLVGKGRDYYAVLLAIKTVVDWRTFEVSNTLTPDSREWFHKLGYKEETIDKFLQEPDKRILNKIQSAFDHLNATLEPSFRIQKWTILPRDFSVQGRELTFILSIRRLVVEEKYAETINSMYIEKITT